MKKLLLGAVALVALGLGGTPVKAADMPVYRKAEPLPVWTWAGVYFGAHAGGAWGTSSWTERLQLRQSIGKFALRHYRSAPERLGRRRPGRRALAMGSLGVGA